MAHIDAYNVVTNRIISLLESGVIPWHRPWHGGLLGAISYANGKPYSLLNQLLLGKEGEYLTFKQCNELGGQVKKGAKGHLVVFFKVYRNEEYVKEDGKMVKKVKSIPVLRYYTVFHIEDCEGIKPKYGKPKKVISPIKAAEKILTTYYERESVSFKSELSNRAYYSPSEDKVVVPSLEQYDDASEYYSTAFHETIHSTGHSSRLNRDMTGHFGSDSYSKEELIAELGAAYLLNKCQIDGDKVTKNNAAYIQGWVEVLKSDKKFIIQAASRAERAVKYVLTGNHPPVSE